MALFNFVTGRHIYILQIVYLNFHNYRELQWIVIPLQVIGSVLEFFPSLAGGRLWWGQDWSLACTHSPCPCTSPLGISLLPDLAPLPFSTCQALKRALLTLPPDSFLLLCKLIHVENNLCFPLSRELNFSPRKGSNNLIDTKLLVNEISCLIPL